MGSESLSVLAIFWGGVFQGRVIRVVPTPPAIFIAPPIKGGVVTKGPRSRGARKECERARVTD
jgi:hypothetical protein